MRRQPVKLKGIGKGYKTLYHRRLILCIANAWSIYYILSQRAVPIINCICRACQNDAVEASPANPRNGTRFVIKGYRNKW